MDEQNGIFAMIDFTSNDRLFLSFSVALGLIVAGTGNALFGPRAPWIRSALAAGGLAASLVSVQALLPAFLIPFALAGSGALLLSIATRKGLALRLAAATWNRLRNPRLGWGLAALAGFGLLGLEFVRYDIAEDAAFDEQDILLQKRLDVSPYVVDETRLAKTDRGSAIHLLTAGETKSVEELTATELETLGSTHLNEYVIRRGPADENSNCHGWVFAGGKFAIRGSEVDTILNENEYELVEGVRPGDLSVYRQANDNVAHTAIVRSVFDDGTVLVEGKWGRFGVFLHAVDRSVYGTRFGFYRSPRNNHVINSIP